jgi:hypothetical protein
MQKSKHNRIQKLSVLVCLVHDSTNRDLPTVYGCESSLIVIMISYTAHRGHNNRYSRKDYNQVVLRYMAISLESDLPECRSSTVVFRLDVRSFLR